jgi:hypothetical protein
MSGHETVFVLACILPTGRVVFAWDSESAHRVIKHWKDGLSPDEALKHKEAGTLGGFVQVKMLKADFDAIDMAAYPEVGK